MELDQSKVRSIVKIATKLKRILDRMDSLRHENYEGRNETYAKLEKKRNQLLDSIDPSLSANFNEDISSLIRDLPIIKEEQQVESIRVILGKAGCSFVESNDNKEPDETVESEAPIVSVDSETEPTLKQWIKSFEIDIMSKTLSEVKILLQDHMILIEDKQHNSLGVYKKTEDGDYQVAVYPQSDHVLILRTGMPKSSYTSYTLQGLIVKIAVNSPSVAYCYPKSMLDHLK